MWASSSTRQTIGRRMMIASTSISRSVTPRYSTTRGGMISRSPIWSCGLAAAVRLDQPDHDVDALRLEPVPFAQHRIGLARAGRRAQVNLEPARAFDGGSGSGTARASGDEAPRKAWETNPGSFVKNGLTDLKTILLVELQIEQQHVDPRRGSDDRRPIDSSSSRSGHAPFEAQPASLRNSWAWKKAASSADVRIEARARRRHQVDGCRAGSRVASSAAARSATALRKSGLFVPRFEPPAASAL